MEFNDYGLLPPQDYELTFTQLRKSLLVIGPQDETPWDRQWRSFLIKYYD